MGSKWGINHPDFRRTGTFGEKKDLPREDRAPSDGQRFEQILQALSLSAGAEGPGRGRDPGTPEVLRVSLGLWWVGKLWGSWPFFKRPIGLVAFYSRFCG